MKKEVGGPTLIAIVAGVVLLLVVGGFLAYRASQPETVDGSSGERSGPSQPGGALPQGAGGEADRMRQMQGNMPANQNQAR